MNLRANQNWGDLGKQFESISNKGKSNTKKEVDDRFYVPGKDSDGNVAAVIRFLPSPDSPAVMVESKHFIKGASGKAYVEECPKSHGKSCPACSWIGKSWGDGDKDAYKKWGAKDKYVSNILVINDVNNPSNNGKVFLFRFGKGIYNMIEAKVNPTTSLDEPSIVFDYFEGENFKLVGTPSAFNSGQKNVDFIDFKRSEFKGKSKLGDDSEIERVDGELISMAEWLPENKLKTFDELKARLEEVTSGATVNSTPVTVTSTAQKGIDQSVADAAAIDKLLDSSTNDDGDEPGDDDILARLSQIRSEM